MPEHIKALIVIVFIALAIYTISKPAFANILPSGDFDRRKKLWFVSTLILFLSYNFWIYIIISAVIIVRDQRNDKNKVALFLALLFVAPPLFVEIPQVFDMSCIRLLEFIILLPAYFTLMRRSDTLAFGRIMPDKFLAMYLIFTVLMEYREEMATVTGILREGVIAFTDIFLPYYVVSRSLRDIRQFKEAIASLVIASILVAGCAIFEYFKHWLLYPSLAQVMGVNLSVTKYLMRGDSLRAIVTTGQAIVLGYVLMIAIGFFCYLRTTIPQGKYQHLILAILAMGLYASVSRGPWVGTVVFLIVFVSLGQNASKGLSKLISAGIFAFVLASTLPGGEKLIDLLPFIGKADTGSVEYRQQLLENGLIVFQRNPLLGLPPYWNTPEMQKMRQGEGIIDMVNSYLGILLNNGLVGLGLFLGVFGSILWGIYKIIRRFESRKNEYYQLGRAILAVLISVLFTIYTVSSILLIPTLYWILAGMGAAYIQMVRQNQSNVLV